MSVFAELDPPDQLIRLLGFESASCGPLVVLITRTAGRDVQVFDAASGERRGHFSAQGHLTNHFRGIHVYESESGPVLVLAPPGEPVRQWLLPDGRPVDPPIAALANSRAVTSYRVGDDRVLAVADSTGLLHRFHARTGRPEGRPLRFRPAPRESLWARVTGKADQSAEGILPTAAAVDDGPSGPSVLVADGRHGFWRVEPRTVAPVPLDPPQSVIDIAADPLGRPHAAAIRGGNSFGVYDTVTGENLSRPVSVPAVLEDDATVMAAAADGDDLSVFMAVGSRLVRVAGDRTEVLLGAPLGEQDQEGGFVDGLCVLPVNEGTAVFACDSERIYRFLA